MPVMDLYSGMRDLGQSYLAGVRIKQDREQTAAALKAQIDSDMANRQQREDADIRQDETQRRGQDMSASTQRRGQDAENARTYITGAGQKFDLAATLDDPVTAGKLIEEAKNDIKTGYSLMGIDYAPAGELAELYGKTLTPTDNPFTNKVVRDPGFQEKHEKRTEQKIKAFSLTDPKAQRTAYMSSLIEQYQEDMPDDLNEHFNPNKQQALPPEINVPGQKPQSAGIKPVHLDWVPSPLQGGEPRKMFAPFSDWTNRVITGKFGEQRNYGKHPAIDVAGAKGEPLAAMSWGKVITVEHSAGGYGNSVVYEDRFGNRVRYSHLDSVSVKPGDVVDPYGVDGVKVIGTMGNTGSVRSSSGGDGTHLDLRVTTPDGNSMDPVAYFKGEWIPEGKQQAAAPEQDAEAQSLDTRITESSNELTTLLANPNRTRAQVDARRRELNDLITKREELAEKRDKAAQEAADKEEGRKIKERELAETSRSHRANEGIAQQNANTARQNADTNQTKADKAEADHLDTLKGMNEAKDSFVKKNENKIFKSDGKTRLEKMMTQSEYAMLEKKGGKGQPPAEYQDYVNAWNREYSKGISKLEKKWEATPEGKQWMARARKAEQKATSAGKAAATQQTTTKGGKPWF